MGVCCVGGGGGGRLLLWVTVGGVAAPITEPRAKANQVRQQVD